MSGNQFIRLTHSRGEDSKVDKPMLVRVHSIAWLEPINGAEGCWIYFSGRKDDRVAAVENYDSVVEQLKAFQAGAGLDDDQAKSG
jgi:hypothetical protein